jgi:hypothetical protein
MSLINTLHNVVTGTVALYIYYNNCEAGRYMDLNIYQGSSKTKKPTVSFQDAGIWSGKYQEYGQS